MEPSILVIAGEVSGDLHAAGVVRAFKAKDPDTTFWGLGGDELQAEGVELLQHTDRMSVMGLIEVLRHYRFLKSVFDQVLEEVDHRKPKMALLVDYPGFNLRLAAELKKRGVKVCYYICPKVWAWNKKRITQIVQRVDRLMVIFPFEVEVFRNTGLQVDFVGNPLVAQIDRFLSTEPVNLPWETDRRIALFPGSRTQEIHRILPTLLAAAKQLETQIPELSFMIASPNARIEALVNETIEQCPEKPQRLSVVCGASRELMRQAETAIVKSGTATLETALIGTPQVIVYKTSAATYWFARAVLTIKHIGLVNIVADRSACPELIQKEATAATVSNTVLPLLSDTPERHSMLDGYQTVRKTLGEQDAGERVAEILLNL